MKTLVRLEMLRILRNRRYLFFTLAYPVVLYLIFSHAGGKNADVDGTSFTAYYMVSMAGFGALGAVLNVGATRIATERKAGWTRQLRLTTVSGRQYVLSKLAAAAVVSLPAIALVLVVGAAANHVRLQPWQWGAVALSLWLGSFVFAVLGIALGYLATPDTAQPILMLVYLGLSLLGGMWMPITTFPHVIQTIGHLTPTFRFSHLGWQVLGGHAPRLVDVVVLAGYLVAFTALAAWRYRRDEADAV